MTKLVQTRPCIKKKFFSEKTAQSAVDYVQQQRKKNKSRRNVNIIATYKCPFCNFWHTTSQQQGKKKRGLKNASDAKNNAR